MNGQTELLNDERQPKPRTRSPNYPAVTLQVALEKARAIWTHEKKNPASMTALASDLEMNLTSSSFKLVVSALVKYGLLEELEDARERSLKLSDMALNIILNEQEDSQERVSLLKQCALAPKIHAALWTRFNGELPSDANLKRQLIVDDGFNPDAVDAFIKNFRDTIEFAKLTPSDKIEIQPTADNGDEVENDADKPINRKRQARQSFGVIGAMSVVESTKSMPASVLREFSFPLTGGLATLKVPFPLSLEDFESLLKMITTFREGLVKRSDPISLECAEGWKDKAKALAELGLEFNLTGFDYSFEIANAKQVATEAGFELGLDLDKRVAFFRKRADKK